MSRPPTVVVLGGGLAGIAAAYALARAGSRSVTVIERGDELGGLAGTFHREGHFYPLAYHHILHRDHTLHYFLDRIGALARVRWRRIQILFHRGGQHYNLAHPFDFARFPMSWSAKLGFVRLMLHCFRKSDWSEWHGRSAAELVDSLGGSGTREALFESLTRLKFDLACSEVSGAWLGARLYFREGSAPLGYIPATNWTKVLCDGLTRELTDLGVEVRLRSEITALHAAGDRIREIQLADGERLAADRLVSTLPVEVYRQLAPSDATAELRSIRYTAIISAICATRQPLAPDFYWMNMPSRSFNACGLFRLESLNPTIGARDESCLNFVTHVPHRDDAFFARSDDRLWDGYRDDFRRVFGNELIPEWTRISRLPLYSPVFVREYRNPPVRSGSLTNVYFAGNYRTFPSVASTGTALQSGLEAARALLRGHGSDSELPRAASAFRLPTMPRG